MRIVEIYLQFWQLVPLYPEEHVHRYTLPDCWQNPPFWQGLDAQGLTGGRIRNEWKTQMTVTEEVYGTQ